MVVAAAILAVVSVALTLRAHAAGGHATSVQLKMPTAAVPMSGGDVLIADSENNVVRKVDPSGNIATVAGDGADCGALCAPDGLKMGDGGPATKAELDDPTDAVPYPGGGFLIADATDNLDGPGTIRYVNASGIISTVAGGAATVCSASTDLIGDGCPATQAKLANPTAAVPVAGGGFLIADSFDAVVRRVGADGKIQTVAGIAPGRSTTPCTGSDGLGNGCPANEVQMGLPMAAIPYNIAGAAVTTPGSGFLVTDEQNCVVHYVNASGIMTTVAGTGVCTGSYTGASGKATSVALNAPTDARPTADGGFLIADAGNCRVLKVKNGQLSTVVLPPEAAHPTQPNPPDCGYANYTSIFSIRTVTAAIPVAGGAFLTTTPANQVDSVTSTGRVTLVAGHGPQSGGPPPKPPVCTLKVKTDKVLIGKAKKVHGKRPPEGVLTLFAKCSQAAKVWVSGKLTERPHKRSRHAKVHAKTFKLGPVNAIVRAGTKATLKLKLKRGELKALRHKVTESVRLTLTAANLNGEAHAHATVQKLRPGK